MSGTNTGRRCTLLAAAVIILMAGGCDFLPGLSDDGSGTTDEVSLFPVLLRGDWGYVNANGRITIEPEFDEVSDFADGLAVAGWWWGVGYIDETGEFVIDPKFDNARPFSEGLAAVELDDRWGYIDRSGQWVINPMFHSARSFSDGRAFVRTLEWEWEYIDTSGNVVRSAETPEFDDHEYNDFSEGLAMYEDDEGNFGYVNLDGEPVIPAQYSSARPFFDGRAAIKISDRWGFIDRTKSTVIAPQFISAGSFGSNLAPVRKDGNLWGYVDESGTMQIEAQYEEARQFVEGRAAVMQGGKWGYIDNRGNTLVEPQFDEAYDFKNGLGRVRMNVGESTRYGYMDRDGKYVWYPTD